MKKYKVVTKLDGGETEDCWTVDGEPERFDSIKDANWAINEHVQECKRSGLVYRHSDFEVVPA